MPIGVPQGSIWALIFLVYINNLTICKLHSDISLYADDRVLYYPSKNLNDLEQKLNADLAIVSEWFTGNLLTLNSSKCKFIVFGSPQKLRNVSNISIQVDGKQLERTESFKHLGVTIQQSMSWTDHVDIMTKKVNQRIDVIKRIKYLLPIETS